MLCGNINSVISLGLDRGTSTIFCRGSVGVRTGEITKIYYINDVAFKQVYQGEEATINDS